MLEASSCAIARFATGSAKTQAVRIGAKSPAIATMAGPNGNSPGARNERAGFTRLLCRMTGLSAILYCGFAFFFFVVLCAALAGAVPLAVPPADGLLAAGAPAAGGVGGPFCAIASEVAPAIKAAAMVSVLRVAINSSKCLD
jgi:hypothetical protein